MENGPGGLEVLEARAAIADLIHLYARNVRHGDYAGSNAIFTEDAVFEVGESSLAELARPSVLARIEGRDAVVAYIRKGASSGGGVCPMIHNIMVEVRGEEASSTCVMTAFVAATATSILGEYRDTFRREDGRWLFSSRSYTMVREDAGRP